MAQKYFIKATLDNGVSGYDEKFIYKLGLNVHPKPDKLSKNPCGIGIHLARNIEIVKRYVMRATEFYLTTPNLILGSDTDKIRTDACIILGRIPPDLLEAYEKAIAPAYRTLLRYTLKRLS